MIFRKKENILIGVIILLGLILRLWGVGHNLPLLPDPDEQMNVNRSVGFGSGDLNPHNFRHPAAHQYMLFVLFGFYFVFSYLTGTISSIHDFELHFISDPTYFYLIARCFIVLFGSATLYLIYLIGKDNYGRRVGLLSSFFLMATFLHAIYYIPKGEIPTTFFICLSFIYILTIYRENKLKDYILAGIFAGLALGTKYYSGLLILPLIASHFFNKSIRKFDFLNKKIIYSILFMVLAFFLTNPFTILDFKTFVEHFIYQIEDPSRDTGTLSGSGAGHFFYLKNIFNHGLGSVLGSISLLGFLFSVYRHEKCDLIILSFIIPFFLVLGLTNLPRNWYMIPLLPFLVLFGSRLLDEFLKFFLVKLNINHIDIIFVMVALILILYPMYNLINYNLEANEKDIRIIAKEWVEKNIPNNAKILLSGLNVSMIRAAPLEDNIKGLEEKIRENEKGVFGISKKGLNRYYRLKIESHRKGFIKGKSYDLTSTKGGKNIKPIEYYRLKHYDYFVLSDEIEVPYWNERRKEMFPNVVNFYNQLGDSTVLLKSFKGQGRLIKIFKLKY